MGERKALHAYVSDDAHDHWHDTAAELGVSVSAILEALAPRLRTADSPITGPSGEQLIATARHIDTERRRRSR